MGIGDLFDNIDSVGDIELAPADGVGSVGDIELARAAAAAEMLALDYESALSANTFQDTDLWEDSQLACDIYILPLGKYICQSLAFLCWRLV